MTFNALRHRALWGFNDRSHGTNPDCSLDNPKQAIIRQIIIFSNFQGRVIYFSNFQIRDIIVFTNFLRQFFFFNLANTK